MKILESIPAFWAKHHELWSDQEGGDPVAYFCKDGAMVCCPCAEERCERGDIPESAETLEPDDGGARFCDDCTVTISMRGPNR